VKVWFYGPCKSENAPASSIHLYFSLYYGNLTFLDISIVKADKNWLLVKNIARNSFATPGSIGRDISCPREEKFGLPCRKLSLPLRALCSSLMKLSEYR
jgi:hypothetical protein